MKNESYVIFVEELNEAYKIAVDMVNIYKMENDKNSIIKRVREKLKISIKENLDEIERLKIKLLKDEIVF